MKKFNFWKYFTITVLLLIGLCCVGVLYLFFVGGPLFNLKYVSYHDAYKSREYNITKTSINTIKLSNNKFEVNVLDSSTDNITLVIHNGVFGFTTVKNSKFDFSENLENGVLTFDVSEPHGFAVTGNSKIELYLPAKCSVDLILSNYKAATEIDTSAEIKNLSYSTKAGNLKFIKGKISGQMNLSLSRAKFTIDGEVETNTNEVNLRMTSGSFSCSDKDFNVINLISSTSGVIRAGKCNEINGNNANAGGSITIDEVGNANLVAGDTNVRISTLTSGVIKIGKTGKIEIGKTVGRVNLSTESGNISVDEANFELTCTASSGNISVGKAYKVVNAETTSGDIYVNFDFEENRYKPLFGLIYRTKNSYADDVDNRRILAKTSSGSISCYGAENVDVLITGSGRANLYMENILGNNIIKAERGGSVYVLVKEFTQNIMPDGWAHFMLTATSSGSVRVNFTQMEATGGVTESIEEPLAINPAQGKEQGNQLTIESGTGSITVLDDLTASL